LLLSDLDNWFVATRRDARSISFDLAKQIFDRSSRREVDPAIQEHGNAWILKTHPGSDEVDYWSRFLAEGVVAIGWEDLDGNPSKVEDDKKLEDAIRQAYPPTEERKRNYRYIREVMRDFVSWANGDLVLLCRGYPGNGNSPVHVNGFARIVGPFYDDAASDWWRFKHRAEIQVVDGKLPRRQMAEALGMRSLLGTLHSTDVDALHRVAGLCKEFLDVSLTF
jgi:hypothetical protein